jgi:hypothetical protein
MQMDEQHPDSTDGKQATNDAVGDLERMAHGFALLFSHIARGDLQ